MREIKFRGKCDEFNKWVYGDLSMKQDKGGHAIITGKTGFLVNLMTIGQFTGLNDIFGHPIYEGDIIKVKDKIEGTVVFSIYSEKVVGKNVNHTGWHIELKNGDRMPLDVDNQRCEIIGNIYE